MSSRSPRIFAPLRPALALVLSVGSRWVCLSCYNLIALHAIYHNLTLIFIILRLFFRVESQTFRLIDKLVRVSIDLLIAENLHDWVAT